ncbi:MAG: DUF2207 domain-containing protein [Coriobacteriia bacterium]|nr:DUF2207 domain-containing protein [Coriobacteriia bacterium]
MKSKIFKYILVSILTIGICCPTQAFAYTNAKTHSWKTTINANIDTDGSIQVSEQRIIDITKFIEKAKKYNKDSRESITTSLNPLIWGFDNFPEETDVTANNAKIAILGNDDKIIGQWSNIPSVTYISKWNYESTPNATCIAYNAEKKQVCMFSELTNPDSVSEHTAFNIISGMTGSIDPQSWTMTKAIINFDYSINNAPIIYKDVADFNWAYVSDTWGDESYNVDLKVNIPVGSQSIASPLGKVSSINNDTTERNIYAWGHGSSSGVVNLDASGIVTLKNDVVPAETNAELRLVFPAAWLSNLNAQANISHNNQTKLTQILKDESAWHDQRQKDVYKLILPLIAIPVCILFSIISLILLIRYKRHFKEQAVSNTKVADLNPCLIVRLKNWNHEHVYDIAASVLHLNDMKKIKIKHLHSGDFEIELKNKNYSKNPYRARSIDSIDKRTINFLFGVCSTGYFKLQLYDLLNFAKVRSHDFIVAYLAWHSGLTDEVNELTNFKSNYDRIRHVLFVASILLGITSIILGILFQEWITPACGIISAFVIGFIANTLRNKIYFKDSKDHVIHAVDIPIGIAEYNDTIDEFKNKFTEVLTEAVLTAQDKLC